MDVSKSLPFETVFIQIRKNSHKKSMSVGYPSIVSFYFLKNDRNAECSKGESIDVCCLSYTFVSGLMSRR